MTYKVGNMTRKHLALMGFLFASAINQAHAAVNINDWSYATDPHGSTAHFHGLKNNAIAVEFTRVPRVDKQNNSWVELIYTLPNGNLSATKVIKIQYQSDQPLVVKLSQSDYGKEGDKSYAHYQAVLPKAQQWHTHTITLDQFERPLWTPSSSLDKGLKLENISAIYLVPDLTDEQGGKASLAVKSIKL